jgi:long-subunit acyl-CoA synthetase (AMP-forming)
MQNPAFPIAVPNKPDDVVTVVYTSGSTGLPKVRRSNSP